MDHTYGVWLLSQVVSGGSWRAIHTVSKHELEAGPGESWSVRDARQAADRYDRTGYVKPPTCPACNRRLSGGLLTCQCPPAEPADDLATMLGQVDDWIAKAHQRLANCGGTLMDRFEREQHQEARKELRIAQTILANVRLRIEPVAIDVDELAQLAS